MSFVLSFSPEADEPYHKFATNDLSSNPKTAGSEVENSHYNNKEANCKISEEQEKFEEEVGKGGGGPGSSRRYHHIFRDVRGVTNSSSSRRSSDKSSASSLLDLMSKPSPSEIRRWMADTQETVDRVVTSWQEDLIDNSTEIVGLLDDLIQFLCCLDTSSGHNDLPIPSLLSVKLVNSQGTFESAINVYLHVILLAVEQVTNFLEKVRRRTNKSLYQQTVLEILSQFSLVAEDALQFLKTDEKFLVPVCSRVLEMRNELFGFLRSATQQPPGQIIPISRNVSLKKLRMKEDHSWLENSFLGRFSSDMEQFASRGYDLLEIKVRAKDFIIILQNNTRDSGGEEHRELEQDKEQETKENLELIQLLLIQLRNCISFSNKTCKRTTQQLSSLHSSLSRKFQVFSRTLNLERRLSKLKAENCSSSLKTSLCQLEIKFHQVEKILEEIPEHMKRVIGIADVCSRQLILRLGLDDQINELGDWTSPIEGLSEEFFNKRRGILGCIPYLWRLIARLILGSSGSPTKLEEFWEQVRGEVEDFQKEVKLKELEEEQKYALTLTIPIVTKILEGDIRINLPILSKLAFHRAPDIVELKQDAPASDTAKVNVISSQLRFPVSATHSELESVTQLSEEPGSPSPYRDIELNPAPPQQKDSLSMEPLLEDAALLEEMCSYFSPSSKAKNSANVKTNKTTEVEKNIHIDVRDIKLKYKFDNYIIVRMPHPILPFEFIAICVLRVNRQVWTKNLGQQ